MSGFELFLAAMFLGAGFELGRFVVLLVINTMLAATQTKKKAPDGQTAQ
jgi:hypothetical protein